MKTISVAAMTMTTKKTPMFLLLMIIMMTMSIANSIVSTLSGHWSAVLLVMVYVSGVMVLFMYVASLSPYEKNKSKTKMWPTLTMLILLTTNSESKQTGGQSGVNIFNNSMGELWSNLTITTLLGAMATIIPKMMMSMKKGMKSSK